MGWETRRGRRYLYGKKRTPEGVRSVYLGTGEACEALAECAEGRRIEAAAARRRLRRQLAPVDDALDALRLDADALRPAVRAYLVATGHRTHRGQWRRARYLRPTVAAHDPLTRPPDPMARKKDPAPRTVAPGTGLVTTVGTAFTVPEGTDADTLDALGRAFDGVDSDKPTPADVTRLRDALGRLPPEAFEPFADRIAFRSAASLLAGKENGAAAIAEAEGERFAAELAGDGGPLVKAAAVQAAAAHMVVSAVTQSYSNVLRGSYSLKEGDHFERRLNAAQRRYLRALATVAALRRAEGVERDRAARLDAERGAEKPARMDLHHFLSPVPSGDSTPAPADVELVTG